jgi:galactose mutarotase-like enzyme
VTLHYIHSAGYVAAIDSLGAQLRSLQHDGIEYLWNAADPWNYSAPVLFPIISGLPGSELLHNGATHQIASHGFARRTEWAVTGPATFELASSAETLAAYPFDFRLIVEFTLNERLTVRHTVVNASMEPMPFLLGGHPAFRWPLPGADDGAPHTVSWTSGGTTMRQAVKGLRPGRIPSPAVDGVVVLDRAQFAEDAMLFDDLSPRQVTYTAPGAAAVVLRYDDFTRLGIWSKPDAGDFVCLEPWSGYPAPQGFDGDILSLPEATVLPAGESTTLEYSIEIKGA